ncbi:MAG: tRNA (uridine(34)/cytosine(34)/5-carboxymethylaminomethyluridine(34)-2'-O)-methyltransferase TrmL [Deltaproteobacteria bacterium]|nr:MAG: tRNA (uridine(34)/cytosine(34)/5-carboxymethylaminomethyluridine(34)-2'-O)-methyltransferase TrmL [Deltaproteobacteria bacterium]
MDFTPFHIVLVEPEIPPNTGNIARLCAATGTILHLVGKLGFSLDDRQLKRAGLDYWPAVTVKQWKTLAELRQAYPKGRYWYTSKKARKSYYEANFQPGDFLVFGKETLGLPESLLAKQEDWALRIPMETGIVRSLNLASAAGIILYEARRQVGQR